MRNNRSKVIRARLSDEERAEVIRRANEIGLTLSTYIRKSVLQEKIIPKTDIQIAFELRKIGVNLNQLVKHINTLPVEENISRSLKNVEEYIRILRTITDRLV